MALTSQEPRAGCPLTLELTNTDLPNRSWVKISQIRTLAVERIGDCLARMDEATLSRVLEGLGDVLGK